MSQFTPLSIVRSAVVAIIMVSVSEPLAGVKADEKSEEILDSYFEAIGGRQVWSAGRGEYVLAKVQDPRFPLPATFEFCWSWEEARTSDRTRFQGLTQFRSFNGSEGWTYMKPAGDVPGDISPWSPSRVERGTMEWKGNFEILTHRLSKKDPAVTTEMGQGPWENWIGISVDGDLMSYLLIDENGAPKKFHRLFDKISIVFGPLAERGDINFPAWGAFEGGEPFDLIAFEILPESPQKPFLPVSENDPAYMDCR